MCHRLSSYTIFGTCLGENDRTCMHLAYLSWLIALLFAVAPHQKCYFDRFVVNSCATPSYQSAVQVELMRFQPKQVSLFFFPW